jgi:hypothetical protein
MRMHHGYGYGGCGGRGRSGRRAIFGLGLASLAAALWTTGCDDHRRHARHHDERRWTSARIERALDWLEVEGEARERARALALRLLDEATAMRADGALIADELLAQWSNTSPDATRLHEVLDRQVDALRTRAHRVVDDALALHATLDAEQRAEVADKIAGRGRGYRRHHW